MILASLLSRRWKPPSNELGPISEPNPNDYFPHLFRYALSESAALSATVNGLIPPDEHLLHRWGSMNRNPTDQVMPGFIRLVPGAGYDAPAAAGRPFLPVGSPESQTAFGIDIPFAVTWIVV